MRHLLLMGFVSLQLACARPAPEDPSVIGESLQQALDRAEALEPALEQQADRLRRELEHAERGGRSAN